MLRREFLKFSGLAAVAMGTQGCNALENSAGGEIKEKPNFLFCIADDWGWPNAGAYGDAVIKTPTFDRLAKEGVVFEHAYVSSPSCTPSRGAILTGQYHWRLKEGANLWGKLDVSYPVFPLKLKKGGYHIGWWHKCWGPGFLKDCGYVDTTPTPCGKKYGGSGAKAFENFLAERQADKPFFFWLGGGDPHRDYKKDSGRKSGIDVDKITVPNFYPDVEEIRSDFADMYFEIQRFDRECAKAIKYLEENGELDNTVIIITGDNGIPFPRCKSNIYDMGVRVPLAVRWGNEIPPDRRVTDFVSLVDLAPTFLEAAGLKVSRDMTGRSLLTILRSKKKGRVDSKRDHVIFGKERHVVAQKSPSIEGYPCRGIRTDKYMYIRNFKPDRWPAGVMADSTHPRGMLADCDPGPTRKYLIDHRDDPALKKYFDLAFGKRPAEELYDISKDPDQLNNLAQDEKYSKVQSELSKLLTKELRQTKDPRVIGGGEKFDEYPFKTKYKLNI